jgi:excinuclease ABC subunit C
MMRPRGGVKVVNSPQNIGPTEPGVYLFRGPEGEVLYVGKSTNLKKRVLDHLHVRNETDALLASTYATVEFFPTDNEREALLMEANFIREYKPRYNVLLKDDKSYPYVSLTLGERFPRVSMVRRPRRTRGTVFFGPYTSAREARNLVRVIAEAFLLRRCRRLPKVACIYYHMGTCSAPCIGVIDEPHYRERVEKALMVLRGNVGEVVPWVEKEMRSAAGRQEFERAAILRDALAALENLRDRQRVVRVGGETMDVVALTGPASSGSSLTAVGMVKVREGQVVGAEASLLQTPEGVRYTQVEVLSEYLSQYYLIRTELAPVLYLPPLAGVAEGLEGESSVLQDTIAILKEAGVEARVAVTGRPRSLLDLALSAANARLASKGVSERGAREGEPPAVIEDVKKLLSLDHAPRRIEGVDISILQGVDAVGSVVVFVDGEPAKSEYRRFRIRGPAGGEEPPVPHTDDFAMINEVVKRRFHRLKEEGAKLPDLLLIDGGAGQVASAVEALRGLDLGKVPLIGLAKREEEVYLPGKRAPLKPDKNSNPMLLLRHVRDEAHRFALAYHHKRRQMALRGQFAVERGTKRAG